MIYFTNYASRKFEILKRHNFEITKEQVIKILETPDFVHKSKFSFYVGEGKLNDRYTVRVVFKKEGSIIKVITFYPIKL